MPENNMTRQDMFVILYRILNILEKFDGNIDNNEINFQDFSDIDEIDDYAMSFRVLCNAGIINGDGNKLKPKDNATRAETAQVLYNILNHK